MQRATKPIEHEVRQNSSLMRYRGLILSITVFIVLIAVLMAFSIYASTQIAKNTAQLSAAQELHSRYQQTSQSLYSLRLSATEDPKAPQSQFAINELKAGIAGAQEALEVLTNGGELQPQQGQTLSVESIKNADIAEELKHTATLWEPIYNKTSIYLKDAQLPTASPYPLEDAAIVARTNHASINDAIHNITNHLTKTSNEQTHILRLIQISGIAVALLYFVIFIAYFMRKLRAADAIAAEAQNETTEILNTVNSGLFLLDHDLNIGHQYSRELENLLGTREIAGRNMLDVLHDKLPDEDVENTASFIEQLYNDRVKERLIGSLNPLTRVPIRVADLKTGEEKTRYLDFKFNRVYHGKSITKVLVSVADETDAVLLEQKIEQEREQNDIQLDMLAALLNADQKMVNDFIRNTKRRNLEINNILKRPGETQTELRTKANAIFREVHSLKGEASAFKLHGFTVLAENLEGELKDIQSLMTLTGQDFLGLAVSLEKLMQLTQTIESLSRRLNSGNTNQTGNIESNSLHIPDRFDAAAAQQAYYSRFVSELAARNHKKVNLLCGGLEHELDENTNALVKDMCVQLLRNAVVHGIEAPQTRVAKQKNPVGQIQLNIDETSNGYTVSLRDDGAGIRTEHIKAKAVAMGLYTEEQAANLTTQQIYALLFYPGFSTADKLTGDAGRGVGLDVIKERIQRLGGKISIASVPDAYTRFVFTFPKK